MKIEIEGDEDPLLLMDENYLVVGLSDKRLLVCNLVYILMGSKLGFLKMGDMSGCLSADIISYCFCCCLDSLFGISGLNCETGVKK